MNWTKEEQELITILDSFLDNCARSKKLKNSNYHRFLQQILAVTKGDIAATKQYCQQILGSKKLEIEPAKESLKDTLTQENFQDTQSLPSLKQSSRNTLLSKTYSESRFKSYWTFLFLLLAIITVFFAAKKSPKTASVNTFSNIAIFCPADLIETAQTGINNRDELLLQKAIADFQQLQQQQANQLGSECEQVLWDAKLIYAIDFLASQGEIKKAATYLCSISAKYYQNKAIIPWFTRWSNTNQEFSQWLTEYKVNNGCPATAYLQEMF